MKTILQRTLQWGVILAAMVFIAMFFYTALQRMTYPYDLDFIEDSMLMEALRITQGQPVYIPPNADFNPHVYMPLFFWLGAALFKLGGPSLVSLRSISLTAALAIAVLLYWIADRESGKPWVGLACAGLFLAGYRINGFWYEVARVDSLFAALMLGGLALAFYTGGSNRRLFLSAALLGLAAFTKQTGLFIAAGLAFYLFTTIGRRAWIFVVSFSVLTSLPLFVLNWSTDGWFFYHVFHIGSADPIELKRLFNFLTKELFGVMTGMSLLAVVCAFALARQNGLKGIWGQPWLIGIGMAIAISALGRMRVGGNLNNRIPAYMLLCLAPALWMKLSGISQDMRASARALGAARSWRELILCVLVLIQFGLGYYSPRRFIPNAAMRQSGDRFIQQIASYPGRVLVMMHPYYTLLAGKQPATQIATLWYVRYRGALPLTDDFVGRIREHYYSTIISDESFFETQPDLHELITTYYVQIESLSTAQAPPTITGVGVRPKLIYVPR